MSAAEKLKAAAERDRREEDPASDIDPIYAALPQIVAVVEAAERAIPVSACDFPDGACDHECGRTEDDHSGCLRIKAFAALAALDEALQPTKEEP